MAASIMYEVDGGVPLRTARPDTFWCELVRVFVPDKSNDTGDGDPYGAGAIELKPEHAPQLWSMTRNWPEATALAEIVDDGATVWIHREP